MSTGDKRREGHPARGGGQAHERTGTVPGPQGGKESCLRGEGPRTLLSTNITNTTANLHLETHVLTHTDGPTIHAHTCKHTDAHTGLPVVDTRASILPSESLSLLPQAPGRCPARLGVGRGPAPSLGASAAAGQGRSAGPQAAAM